MPLALLLALTMASAAPAADARVILVTLDGARWQDVLGGDGALYPDEHPLMPALVKRVAREGLLVRAVTSSPAPMSLPGYMALMVGHTSCGDNACARVTEETLPERIARELTLPPAQVAVFASWSKVARAASAKDGRVHVDAPLDGPSRKRANGGAGPPWENARFDDDTAALALAHLEKHKPRFLYLALLDMDEHAHDRDARATADSLRAADRVLAKIFAFVDGLAPEERARTTVLVTADHGRGPGPLWFDHRSALSSSRDIFFAALGPSVQRQRALESQGASQGEGRTTPITQADVRPTIEALLGLRPLGTPLREVVGDAVLVGP